MDDTCILEARRFLNGKGGEGLWNSVAAHFHNTHGCHYRDLVRILKESFTETLTDIWEKKSKIRNITLESKDNNKELPKSDYCTNTINRLFGMNASPGPCFGCRAPWHIRAACPSGGTKPPLPRLLGIIGPQCRLIPTCLTVIRHVPYTWVEYT